MVELTTENSSRKGKAIEHHIISELLKQDFEVYVPVVDDGIDMIIRNKHGGYVEIQVKSRTLKRPNDAFKVRKLKASHNYFIVCHDLTSGNFWVIPSIKFKEKATKKGDFHELNNIDMLFVFEPKEYKRKDGSVHYGYHNELGIELLKRALEHPDNKINIKDHV